MAHLKSGLNLEEGENLVMEIEAEFGLQAPIPLQFFLVKLQNF